MMLAVALFVGATALAAFYSGSETGFYRMTRLRLVMEARTGDPVSRIMLWLANQPTLFVATSLVGTNIAHELASLAIVMGVGHVAPGGGAVAEFVATLLLAPLLFIAGDLTPKNLFFLAPNRLMRRCAPPLVASTILFAPITIVLWLLGQGLKLIAREGGQELRLTLARRELHEMLVEGHESGLLRPVQRTLAQTMLAVAGQPMKNFAAPAGRVVRATTNMSRSEIIRIAQRHRRNLLPMEDPQNKRQLVGYVRTIDLAMEDAAEQPAPLPLVELWEHESFLSALGKLGVARDVLGHVSSSTGKTVGFVSAADLRAVLLGNR